MAVYCAQPFSANRVPSLICIRENDTRIEIEMFATARDVDLFAFPSQRVSFHSRVLLVLDLVPSVHKAALADPRLR